VGPIRQTGGAGGSNTGVAGSAGNGGRAGGSGNAGMSAAGSGGTAGSGAAPGGGGILSLAFDVTTSPVGGRYQPRNIGAIWVEDGNGKLVKSLEVWAALRRRYLTAYVSALAGGFVDVTASATLGSHRAHHATWNMKDRNGAAVPPGKYTLVMETTDDDRTGRSNSVDFDTSAGPQTLKPANAPSFASMQLQLQ
jgi:hypothetical protein